MKKMTLAQWIENGYGSDFFKEEIANEFADKNQPIIEFAYTDYGGTITDRVAICYFKANYPKNIRYEMTSWSGENAILFGDIVGKINLDSLFDDYLEETYDVTEEQFINDEVNDFVEWYPQYENMRDVIRWWFKDNAHLLPTKLDYSESDLCDYLDNYDPCCGS